MPGDSSVSGGRLKNKMWRRQRSSTEPGAVQFVPDVPTDVLPDHIRQRLNLLFGQIHAEFEKLYSENISLQEKVDLLSLRLHQCASADKSDLADGLEIIQKPTKKSGSQISQKIKSTYKTSTSRIANTFKNSGPACGQFVRDFPGHTDGVWEVSVSKSGSRVIGTASADYTAKIWCIESGASLLQYYGHRGSVNSIRFHPSNELVITASGDQTVHIWKAGIPLTPLITDSIKSSSDDDSDYPEELGERNGDVSNTHFIHAPLRQLTGHSSVVVAADWLAGNDKVVSGSWDGSTIVYDAERGTVLETLYGHENELTNVVCHPSHMLVLTSSKDFSVRLWDIRDSTAKVNAFIGHSASVSSAVFASGDKIVSGSDDRTVKLWDMKNMSAPYTTIRTDSAVNRLSVSHLTGVIAVPHDNRHIRLYDLQGNRLGRLPRSNRVGHERMVCSTAWNDEMGAICNLFSAGFEKQVLGWQVNFKNGEVKELKKLSS